ncbi:hypothetical protein [Halorubrum sp. DTA98]|uniref:DUF7860 family protein n=1 Tax=Halorubrum sp. DTA98 TaxID=3402163 RepID=UPI003AAEE199
MARRSHGRELDYSRMTKAGVFIGVALFLVGVVAEYGLHATGSATETLDAVFLTMELSGPLIAVLSVFVFAIALPLIE